MSSLTSKLIRNAPGTDGGAAEGSGPANNTSPTSATNEAPSPGKVITSHVFVSVGIKMDSLRSGTRDFSLHTLVLVLMLPTILLGFGQLDQRLVCVNESY